MDGSRRLPGVVRLVRVAPAGRLNVGNTETDAGNLREYQRKRAAIPVGQETNGYALKSSENMSRFVLLVAHPMSYRRGIMCLT
jgi:hypothetical protein